MQNKVVQVVIAAKNTMKKIFEELFKSNVPVAANTFIYAPGWAGTPDGICDPLNAQNTFLQAGMNNLFASFCVANIVPADNGNSLCYLCNVVGSLQVVQGARVQLKTNPAFYQAVEAIAEKACLDSARFWCQGAPALPGLVSVVMIPGQLGIYVAVNDQGRACNLQRINMRQVSNSSGKKKATSAPKKNP